MVRFYTTVDEAMDLYAEHLQNDYPTHLTPFHQRRAQDREAALAEAMVFWMLKNMGLRPKMNEVVGTAAPLSSARRISARSSPGGSRRWRACSSSKRPRSILTQSPGTR